MPIVVTCGGQAMRTVQELGSSNSHQRSRVSRSLLLTAHADAKTVMNSNAGYAQKDIVNGDR